MNDRTPLKTSRALTHHAVKAHFLCTKGYSKTLNLTKNPKLPQVFLDALASDSKLRKLWKNPPRHGDTSACDWAIGITCLDHNIHDPQMLFDILSQKPHGKYRRDKYEPYLHMTISNLLTTLSQEEDTVPQFLLNFESSDSETQKAKAEFLEYKSSVSAAKAELSHSKNLTKQEKLEYFRSLFRGRTDVFAKRWEKWDGSKSGYSPACRNEWVPGVCKKAIGKKCTQCDYIPLSKEYIERHLRGQMTIGLYPLMKDNTSYFLAVDFDGADWKGQSSCARQDV